MALTIVDHPTINPAAMYYTGRCSTCGTVVTGKITDGWTFYQAAPTAEYAPGASAAPILFSSNQTGPIVDWLYADCPTGGCPATIFTTTKTAQVKPFAPSP